MDTVSTASQEATEQDSALAADLTDKQKEDGQPYSDLAMVNMCRVEMERSVGFENDQILRSQRIAALDMFKGDMRSHVPSLPNRSTAVSADVADAVETILPDLMEIFTGSGDVCTFKPIKPGDEAAATQETDYLQHVIFQDNDGFFEIMGGLKDGLLQKVCLFEFDWKRDYSEERFTGKTLPALVAASKSGKVFDVSPDPAPEPNGEDADNDQTVPVPLPAQTYSFTVRQNRSKAMFWAHPGEDLSVSPETVRLADATYCVARYRPRVQDLIADGYDEETVKQLEPYIAPDQLTTLARDTVGENLQSQAGDYTNGMLRQVEIRKHYIRLFDPDTDSFNIWRVVTSHDGSRGVPKDGKIAHKVARVPFAAGSPYIVPHRFYGFSVADQMIETAKVKTIITRALLDSSYFALNQRYEVDMGNANDWTISDLLRNEPMAPVRSRNGQAIRPLNGAGLGFDAYAALEYFSTVGEQRSGVMRNAQGLAPDTLHDTKGGMLALLNAAQRRVRMIARVLAETCLKDLYLGLHALIREHAEEAVVVQINGSWVQIDPTQWGERTSMTIEVGLGSAGRDQDLQAFGAISQDVQQIVTMQGGLNGPLVTAENAYNLLVDKAKALGRKQPQRYFTDPKTLPPPPAPPPDPKVMAAQLQAQTKANQAQLDAQQKAHQSQVDAFLKNQQMSLQATLKKYQIDQAMATDISTALISAHAKHLAGGNVNQVNGNVP